MLALKILRCSNGKRIGRFKILEVHSHKQTSDCMDDRGVWVSSIIQRDCNGFFNDVL